MRTAWSTAELTPVVVAAAKGHVPVLDERNQAPLRKLYKAYQSDSIFIVARLVI
jgi:hypothetical protein